MINRLNGKCMQAWAWLASRKAELGDEAGIATWVEIALIIGFVLVIALVVSTVVVPAITGGFGKAANTINGLP